MYHYFYAFPHYLKILYNLHFFLSHSVLPSSIRSATVFLKGLSGQMNFLFYRHPLSAILSPVFLCCTVCFYALQSLSTESFINKFRSLNHRWKSVLDKELGLPKSISTTLMRLWEGRLKVKEMYEVFGDFPYSSIRKVSACNAEDLGSIPGSGRSPGEEHGNPLQYSCLENPIDRGAWRAIAHEVTRVRHDLATKPLPPP